MRRAHRRAHIAMWLLIAPALAVVLFLALGERRPEPVNEALPDALKTEPVP